MIEFMTLWVPFVFLGHLVAGLYVADSLREWRIAAVFVLANLLVLVGVLLRVDFDDSVLGWLAFDAFFNGWQDGAIRHIRPVPLWNQFAMTPAILLWGTLIAWVRHVPRP